MCVYTQANFVENEIAVGVQVVVVYFGLWGSGDILIVLAQQLRIMDTEIGCVCEDEREGLVEKTLRLEKRGEVGTAIQPAIGMSRYEGGFVLPDDRE